MPPIRTLTYSVGRIVLLICSLILPPSWAAEMPLANNLQQRYTAEGHSIDGKAKVVLMLVSQPNCSYCELIMEEILKPMLISGRYDQTTLFSELLINAGEQLTDFAGTSVSHDDLAERYNAWATPTLLFLDGQGNEVAERMIGVNTPDLYGYYVDKALAKAYRQINQP